MVPDQLVSDFAALVGAERFKKFVITLYSECRKGRLLFWQQEIWDEFAAAFVGDEPISFQQIVELFRFCPVHQKRMQAEELPVDYLEDYTNSISINSPSPFAGVSRYEGYTPASDEQFLAPYCEDCRREKDRRREEPIEWIYPRPYSGKFDRAMLVKQITLDEYFKDQHPGHDRRPSIKRSMDQARARLEPDLKAREGDRLWLWRESEGATTRGGLAVERNDEILHIWVLWHWSAAWPWP